MPSAIRYSLYLFLIIKLIKILNTARCTGAQLDVEQYVLLNNKKTVRYTLKPPLLFGVLLVLSTLTLIIHQKTTLLANYIVPFYFIFEGL